MPPLNGSYFIKTEQYLNLQRHAELQFGLGRAAVVIIGGHSTGAAEAGRRLARWLAKRREALCVELMTSSTRKFTARGTVVRAPERDCAAVMRELLTSWGARLAHTEPTMLLERVARRILVDSREFSGRVTCFVDLRNPGELSDLLHLDLLHQHLQKAGVATEFVLLYSRLEEGQIQQVSIKQDAMHVVRRWLHNLFRWGELPVAALPPFLRTYDKHMREGEAAPLSQLFAPAWWANGWRMGSSGRLFLEALDKTSEEAGRGECESVPIGTLARICEQVLQAASNNGEPRTEIAKAVRASELLLYWSQKR